ncbi:DUF6133 family protein [Chakrabartyella piscis]|uniref:DUF6133 family protein n=1 Tax=Chakrabartyella piscis TaxID=2918914 RepID=UPI0029585AB4|nr:DUF6133 family protein [Chakrabartyella piscis]
MVLSISKVKFWAYLKGNFLYRVHWVRLRKGVKILIAVVLGALLLAGLYALFNDTVMPTLVERIEDMFDYAG